MARDKTRTKRKERKNIASGVAHVNSSFNNTKILISDVQGNAIAWSSAGTMGFKGSRKSTPHAPQMAGEVAGRKAQEHGVRTLEVEVQGPGSGRESALRALAAVGFVLAWYGLRQMGVMGPALAFVVLLGPTGAGKTTGMVFMDAPGFMDFYGQVIAAAGASDESVRAVACSSPV